METVDLGEIRQRAVISSDTKWNKDWMLPKLNPRISFAYPISSFDFVRPSPDFDSELSFANEPTSQYLIAIWESSMLLHTRLVWMQHENYWHDLGSTSPTGPSLHHTNTSLLSKIPAATYRPSFLKRIVEIRVSEVWTAFLDPSWIFQMRSLFDWAWHNLKPTIGGEVKWGDGQSVPFESVADTSLGNFPNLKAKIIDKNPCNAGILVAYLDQAVSGSGWSSAGKVAAVWTKANVIDV